MGEVCCDLGPKAFVVVIGMPSLTDVTAASAPVCNETGMDEVIYSEMLAGLSCHSRSTVTASSAWAEECSRTAFD